MNVKRIIALLIAVLLPFSLASCGDSPDEPTPVTDDQNPTPYKLLSDTNGRLQPESMALTDVSSLQTVNIDSFGVKLLQELYVPGENLVISPTSLYIALSMLYNGAQGNSATQMAQTMGIGEDRDAFNAYMRDLQLYLLEERGDTSLSVANSLWVRDQYAEYILHSFLETNSKNYGAMMRALNFDDSACVDIINGWISENTNGLIDNMIDPPLDPDTMLMLINTIYFKAKWSAPFDPYVTKKAPFHTSGGDIEVDMMNESSAYLQGYEDDKVQAVSIPYTDNTSSLLVILPKQDPDAYFAALTAEAIDDIMSNMRGMTVAFSMPKVDTESKMQPADVLAAMGMPDIFQPGHADFSAMSSSQATPLYVGDIMHNTVLKIDEEGTEAAAATSIMMRPTGMPMLDMVMTVDSPFFVAIMDEHAGMLFAGAINNPNE